MEDIDRCNGILILPILSYAVMIESRFRKYINEACEGIYIKGDNDPIVSNKRDYYYFVTDADSHTTRQVTLKNFNLDSINYEIYDKVTNEIVFSRSDLENKQKRFSNTPFAPVVGLKLVKAIIRHYLDIVLPYIKNKERSLFEIFSYLKENIKQYENEEEAYYGLDPRTENFSIATQLEVECDPLIVTLNEFINNSKWCIYSVELIGFNLYIKKLVDYRIYEWHRKTDSGEWKT